MRTTVLVVVLSLGLGAGLCPLDAQEASSEGPYTVGPGDVVRVSSFRHQEISGEFPVEEDGTIVFPLLGAVKVAGLTIAEIADALENGLERDYYVDVQIQVEVADYRSRPVTIFGEVARPGTFFLRGRTSLTQILVEAGGVRATAGPTIELRRISLEEGKEVQKVMTFSTSKVSTGAEGQDVFVEAGDVLSVSAKQLYFVTGEVARPGQYEIARGMTLMQAISQAGGQSKFASQSVELHREADGKKEILTFDLAQIRKGKASDPPIRSGDVIIVRRRFF